MDGTHPTDIGGFRVEAVLSADELRTVYRARSVETSLEVALRVLSDTTLANDASAWAWLQQRQLRLALLDDPALAQVVALGVHEGRPYWATRIPRGKTLFQLRADGHDFTAPQQRPRVAFILASVARALDRAHAASEVHGRLSPQHVFVDPGEPQNVQLVGLGSFLEPEDLGLSVDEQYAFLAPEQCLPLGPITHKVDVYGFGALSYWMLTGRAPAPSNAPLEVLSWHQHGTSTSAPSLLGAPRHVDGATLACLRQNADARPESLSSACASMGLSAASPAAALSRHEGVEPTLTLPGASAEAAPSTVAETLTLGSQPTAPPSSLPSASTLPSTRPRPGTAPRLWPLASGITSLVLGTGIALVAWQFSRPRLEPVGDPPARSSETSAGATVTGVRAATSSPVDFASPRALADAVMLSLRRQGAIDVASLALNARDPASLDTMFRTQEERRTVTDFFSGRREQGRQLDQELRDVGATGAALGVRWGQATTSEVVTEEARGTPPMSDLEILFEVDGRHFRLGFDAVTSTARGQRLTGVAYFLRADALTHRVGDVVFEVRLPEGYLPFPPRFSPDAKFEQGFGAQLTRHTAPRAVPDRRSSWRLEELLKAGIKQAIREGSSVVGFELAGVELPQGDGQGRDSRTLLKVIQRSETVASPAGAVIRNERFLEIDGNPVLEYEALATPLVTKCRLTHVGDHAVMAIVRGVGNADEVFPRPDVTRFFESFHRRGSDSP